MIHVHPAALRVLWNSRPKEKRLFAVSDGSAVLGLDLGVYEVGARQIERQLDRAVLAGTSTLVGSVLTMNVAARNLHQVTGCSFSEAVNFVSLNAARYLGVDDRLGSLEVDKRADVCIVTEAFDVQFTMVDGVVAFDLRTR